MKHLQAGAIVATITLVALIAVALIWSGINAAAGPTMATGVIALALLVGIGATVIDYLTEKQ